MSGKALTNYSPRPASDITQVPVQTDFFGSWPSGWKGQLTSQWLLFFQNLAREATREIFWRTLILNDTTVGADIAPWVTAQESGQALKVAGVLRKAITANLVVTIHQNGSPLITCTIDQAVKPGAVLTYANFLTGGAIAQNDVFSWGIVASDGSSDADGVAVFTLLWQ